MFSSILQTDYINNIKEHAIKTKIIQDRNLFRELFEDVEKYSKDNDIIISDIDILITSCCDDTDTVLYKEIYNLYCSSPYKHSNNLINVMAKRLESNATKDNSVNVSDESKWLVLRTSIPHRLLNITYKGREFVKIHCLYRQKEDNMLKSIINPIMCKGFYIDEDICLLPYEIELIDIYRRLYMPNPECVNNWKNLLKLEPLLINETNNRIKNKTFTEIKKGGVNNKKNIDSETIKQILIFKLLPNSNFVLIGEWAIKLIEWGLFGGTIRKSLEKVQIISELEIKETFSIIKNHVKTILPSNPFEITYREHELHIPKDLRIKRYTIYIQIPCGEEENCPVKQITLMDIFINATYELVPYISSVRFLKKKNTNFPIIKIGNPFVLLRFFMIDLWILRIIFSKGLLIQHIVQKKINNIWISVGKIRNPKKLGGIINKSFSLENYIGKDHNEFIFYKNILKEQNIPDYIPYKWKKDKKRYRGLT